MKKHMLSLLVGAAILVGCGGADPVVEGNPWDGQDGTIVSPETARSEGYPVLASSRGTSPEENVSAQYCWATLHYCTHPDTGGWVCSGTPECGDPLLAICQSLVAETC